MKKLLRVILYPIAWIAENVDWGVIIFCGVVMVAVTFLELKVFHIPSRYETIIWLGNTLIAILIFIYAVNSTKRDYEERLTESRASHDSYVRGMPTEDEVYLFETELKELEKKYSGEEAYHRIREFTVKRRAEVELDDIRESIEAVLRRRNSSST